MENKTSATQAKSRDKWDAKNPMNKRIRSDRSAAKRFIKKYATVDELNELKQLINTQLKFYVDGHVTD